MAYLNGLKGIADRVNKIDAQKNFNLMEIDIEKLVPSSNNFYGIREIEELAESIKESGLMHNLVVRKIEDGNYEILSGERRYRALKQLGFKKVPCQVKEIAELDGEILLIQANSKQRELTHIEKMKGIERLKELYKQKKANGEEIPKGKTRDIIGKDIGLSGVQVGRYMKVSEKLIDPLKDKLEEGNITLTQADTLSNLHKEEQQVILKEIDNKDKKLSNAEIDILVEGIKQPVTNKKDKELLNEIEFNDKPVFKEPLKPTDTVEGNNKSLVMEEFKKLLEIHKTPRVILVNEFIEGSFYSQKFNASDDEFDITLTGFSSVNKLKIKPYEIKEVHEINVKGNKIEPKKAYEVAPGIYVWFALYKEE